jgi:hypothetical protein
VTSISLRIGALLRQTLNDRAAAFHILHFDARRFGEGVELALIPAVIAVMQAVGGVNRDDPSAQTGELVSANRDSRASRESFIV